MDTKPTEGALRAARTLEYAYADLTNNELTDPASVHAAIARHFDRESGLRELVEAAERVASVIDPSDVDSERLSYTECTALLRSALARVKG